MGAWLPTASRSAPPDGRASRPGSRGARMVRGPSLRSGRFQRARMLVGLAWRESRTTRRRLLLYMSSISLGVAALVAIDSFSANIIQSVKDQSRALMGGDFTFDSSKPFSPALDSLFDSLSHRSISLARVTTF